MAKLPNSPRKTAKKVAKAPAKKVAARPMKDTQKKNILPGKSPWENKAIKSGKAMTPVQVRMHEEFVAGKKLARTNAANGITKKFTKAQVANQKKLTTKKYYTGANANDSSALYRMGAAANLGFAKASNRIYKKKYSAK